MCAISFLTSTAIKLFLPFVARFLFAFFVFVFRLTDLDLCLFCIIAGTWFP